jgi:hypothetical protein
MTGSSVGLRIIPDLRVLGHQNTCLDDGALDPAMPAYPHVLQKDGAVHLTEAIDAHPRREDATDYLATGDDTAVRD